MEKPLTKSQIEISVLNWNSMIYEDHGHSWSSSEWLFSVNGNDFHIYLYSIIVKEYPRGNLNPTELPSVHQPVTWDRCLN